MADIRWVTEDFAVAPQIVPADLPEIAALGFRTIIANRPDGEAPGQPTLDALAAAASAAGLGFVRIPVTAATPEAIAATGQALTRDPGPILAYCRSGTRSVTLWAFAQAQGARLTPAEILSAARRAGYDLGAQAGALERLHGG